MKNILLGGCMKRIIITIMFVILIIGFFAFFKKNDYKFINNGNNISSQSVGENILNMNFYRAEIEVTVKSNKNTNTYRIKQEYKGPNECTQEVIEPQNVAGVKISYKGNKLVVENTKLNLQTMYENYPYITTNSLFLTSFVEEYKQAENSKKEIKGEEIILETKPKEESKYQVKKKLYLSSKTGKPIKLEVQDTTQNILVYILYNEIEIN